MQSSPDIFPKISIVTPSFNQGKYIEQTICSVLDQNYPNLEYIIIDGGSTDGTLDIIKKYKSKLTYWISEPDKGQTDAINKGFAKCTGEIFNWINSDDYYEPGCFEKLNALFSSPSVNVVCGKEWSFNNDKPQQKILSPGSIIKENIFETIRVGIIDQPCTFFRRSTIEAFFPLDNSLCYVMDRQLWWNYLLRFGQEDILQTVEIFTNFRLHPRSKSVEAGALFEHEFDRLKLSLLTQLKAPVVLEQQILNRDLLLNHKWSIEIKPVNFIPAAFACFYAERCYVKKDLKTTAKLMKYVKRWKGIQMNKTEIKLWIACNLFPQGVTRFLKKLKN